MSFLRDFASPPNSDDALKFDEELYKCRLEERSSPVGILTRPRSLSAPKPTIIRAEEDNFIMIDDD
jgi:hypothetical protein